MVKNERYMTVRLTVIQKLELHRILCAVAPEEALRETMWLRSENSERWLGQITNFARSNALMSIIGYIMGIGDRHLSNILVMKKTGYSVHIDFSDCFEKASFRSSA
jgi:FKBP12-rapamycin complex-associated protein